VKLFAQRLLKNFVSSEMLAAYSRRDNRHRLASGLATCAS
jgi:hypothetical protein